MIYLTPILALDMATKTGWALRDREGNVTSGVQSFEKRRGESDGMRFLRFRAWLRSFDDLGVFDEGGLVAFERAHHRGGHATALCVGMNTEAMTFAAARKIEHTAVHTGTLKKHATGRGNAGKADMVLAAIKRWDRDVSGDDEADALCVLAWAIEEIGEDDNTQPRRAT